MNVAAYVRVSTQEQKEKGYSIPEQEERLRAYCTAREWHLVRIYTDGGFTGANLDRPAMKQLIRDCDAYDLILVWKLDRLSRSQKDTLNLIETFKEHGCAFASMNENFDTSTAFGMAMVGILSAFAQLEREQIKERMMMGKEGRAKSLKWHGGGHAPTGYDYKDGTLYPNDEADQIRVIFDMFLQGESYIDITRHMHSHYATRYTSYNNACIIRRILRNPVYTGAITHRGKIIGYAHEPLIDKDTFDHVQAILESRKTGKKISTGTHLLTGMVFCSCGARMKMHMSRKGGKRYAYYVCGRHNSPNMKHSCNNRIVKESDLDEAVVSSILSLKFKDVKPKPKKTTDHTKEIKKIDAQISRLIDLYQIESISRDDLQHRIKDLEDRRASLTASDAPESTKASVVKIIPTARQIFENGQAKERRAIVDALIRSVVVLPDDFEIHWSF